MTSTLTAPNLWRSASAMLNELLFLITGVTPAHLQTLKQRERKYLREWLAALEVMVRKVLLIEAAAFMDRRRPRRHRSDAQQNAGEGAGGPYRPSKHQPTFTLVATQARESQHPARIRMLGAPASLAELLRDKARAQRVAALRNAPSPAPQTRLANRINALARVIENPLSAIRRLARQIRKAKRIAFDIVAQRVRIPFTFHGDANSETEKRAIAAVLQLPNSS